MNKKYSFIILFLSFKVLYAQQSKIDTLYREDQIYFSANYIYLLDKSKEITQNNFSYSIQLGFIRDMPINKNRNISIGLGLGYAYNTYFTNLLAEKINNDKVNFSTVDTNIDLFVSNITTHSIEIPLEFRWRTSSPTKYRFWRIYTGVSYSYNLDNLFLYRTSKEETTFFLNSINKHQFIIYTSFNFKSAWNIYISYYLNSIMDTSLKVNNNSSLQMNPILFGIRFYFL